MLNRIYKEYFLPLDLYQRLKQSLKYNQMKDIDDLNNFVEDLPHQLKIDVSLFLHEQTYMKIDFLKSRTSYFKAWICPLLKPALVTENQYVYFEEDEVTQIYFLKNGDCGFVLPKFNNSRYISINNGNYFGVIDIIGSLLQSENGYAKLNEWVKYKDLIKRQFTIMATTQCELLTFSIADINKMKQEFLEAYETLFFDTFKRLCRTLKVKLNAMRICQ